MSWDRHCHRGPGLVLAVASVPLSGKCHQPFPAWDKGSPDPLTAVRLPASLVLSSPPTPPQARQTAPVSANSGGCGEGVRITGGPGSPFLAG